MHLKGMTQKPVLKLVDAVLAALQPEGDKLVLTQPIRSIVERDGSVKTEDVAGVVQDLGYLAFWLETKKASPEAARDVRDFAGVLALRIAVPEALEGHKHSDTPLTGMQMGGAGSSRPKRKS